MLQFLHKQDCRSDQPCALLARQQQQLAGSYKMILSQDFTLGQDADESQMVTWAQVLAGAVGQAVGQMEGETAQLLGHLPLLEDWTPRQALVGDSSASVSSTPARLHSALEAGMAQVCRLHLS